MSNIKGIKYSKLGIYVAMSGGIPIDDGYGHVLSINATYGDLSKIKALMDAARSHGWDNLDYEFIPEVRKVSDEEYLVQQQRMEAGLQPDPYEINSSVEAYLKEQKKRA